MSKKDDIIIMKLLGGVKIKLNTYLMPRCYIYKHIAADIIYYHVFLYCIPANWGHRSDL